MDEETLRMLDMLYDEDSAQQISNFRKDVMGDPIEYEMTVKRFKTCHIHNARMDERASKGKFEADGVTPVTYFGHFATVEKKMCFGTQDDQNGPAQSEDVEEPTQPLPNVAGSPQQDAPDWDAIAQGKVRSAIITAAIVHDGLFDLTEEIKDKINTKVAYIMTGK